MKWLLVVIACAAACGDDGGTYTLAQLQDPNTCMECHPKHFTQWSGSMHAYAADDPVFIAMNKRGQRETNGELGDFCLKCHAPMALELGLASGSNFDPATLPAAAKGVTCFFCHNVASVEADHNNGLVLANDTTMRGGAKNPASNPAHHGQYDAAMDSITNKSVMCGSCHDVTTPGADVHLERTYAEWQTTVFALEDPSRQLPVTCSKCHMQPSKDVIASGPNLHVKSRDDGFHDHTMAAIDQALTPFPEMDTQRAEIEKILKPSLAIVSPRSLGTNEAYGGICLVQPGMLTVRVDSLSVGHHFPSGAAQDRRVWLEVVAYDASNNVVFQRGQVMPGQDPELTSDSSLTCPGGTALGPGGTTRCASFFDKTYNAQGGPAHFFWDAAGYDSNLIRPAITVDPNSPQYDHSTTVQYDVGAAYTNVDRIEAKLWARPFPFAAIDELISSGDLDPSVRVTLLKPEYTTLVTSSTWLKSTAGTGLAKNTGCNPF